jgi:hypothetical protein
MQPRRLLVPAFVTALLALAAPASAIFIETPLRMSADHTDVEVGDPVKFHIEPANESGKDHFAGLDVIVRWSMYEPDGTSQEPTTLRDDLGCDAARQTRVCRRSGRRVEAQPWLCRGPHLV